MTSAGQLHQSPADRMDASTLYQILRLRVDVFVVEQACPYPELDGRDLEAGTRQFWIVDDDVVVSTLRLLTEPASADEQPSFRIGRVCTERGHRGQGMTARLISAALSEIGDHVCLIEAQAYLVEMYAKFGFVVQGDEYLEDGIPHVTMRRDPAVPATTVDGPR
ncbi:GNAT family N-acetyltransferase [Gordonia sp. Z-3]|jgi:ElaA protein|uniref:GNAT family N-acetyltransferase n=1 Tax=unclassified Gordonia (in: high G+C Gram-positive bacteria) TaxID=2657482 RepID=UPI000C37DD86|nr:MULTISPECIES: GNAT family N-acetyltransferase [unclassified Gordonia (in: high G+C Gram-positive bacteria)]MAU82123.1 GNAT family N-acetyltransferase [Gordonia sp. (in: high G+C Gram-positive bacteria)]MED5800124.1 GNAT family N-acetyltransferase [Gordonia sp. Z-3]